MADNKVTIEVELTGDGEAKLKKLTGAVTDFGDKGEKSVSKFASAFDVFLGSLASDLVQKGFSALINLGKAFFEDTLVAGVKAAIETEDAISRLNQALATSGRYSAAASADLVEFAQSMQETTKFSDDAVLRAESLIASLTKLSGESLKKATAAAADMSVVLGQDLQTSALQVAKAIDGSAGRLAAYGLHLNDTSSRAENLGKVLAVVNSKFGGAAQAEVNTFSGAMTVLNHAIEDGKKELGLAIIQNQSLVNVIRVGTQIVNEYNAATKSSKISLASFVSDGIVFAVEGTKLFVGFVREATIKVLQLAQAGAAARGVLSTFANNITFGLTDAGKRAEKAQQDFNLLSKEIENLRGSSNAFEQINVALNKMGQAARDGVGKVADNADLAKRNLDSATAATNNLTESQMRLAEEGRKIAEDEAAKADPQIEFDKKVQRLLLLSQLEPQMAQQAADAIVALSEERDQKISDLERKKADEIIAQNNALAADGSAKNAREITEQQAKLKKLLDNDKLSKKDRGAVEKAYLEQTKAIERERLQAGSDALNQLATLQNAKTKEIAVVGKAAAIAQATIDTYVGAGKAGEALAPIHIVGPALAAAAIAAYIAGGLSRVATIAGIGLATGIDEVPPGYDNDTFPARLTSGEGVLDRNTNANVREMASSWPAVIGLLSAILDRINRLENHTTVYLGNRLIIDEVRESILSGRALAV